MDLLLDTDGLDVEETQYGFTWGCAKIERCCSHKRHAVLSITTPKQVVQIRVTPSGLIRISTPQKNMEQTND